MAAFLLAGILASCGAEGSLSGSGELAQLTVLATADEGMNGRTKASEDGAPTNLAGKELSIRYMMELWSESGNGMKLEYRAEPKYQEITGGAIPAVEYNLSLVSRKYTMVLWADIVEAKTDGTITSHYDVGAGLEEIRFPEEASLGSDMYDAFTAVAEADLTAGSKLLAATLKRPFAKIRVLDDGLQQAPEGEYSTSLSFDPAIKVPKTYNALTDEVTEYYDDFGKSGACISSFEAAGQFCLFAGYLFVPQKADGAEGDRYDFTIEVTKADDGQQVKSLKMTDVTVKRNALTTLKGKIIE